MLETLLAVLAGGFLVAVGVWIGRIAVPRPEAGRPVALPGQNTESPGVQVNTDENQYLRERELEETVNRLTANMNLGPNAFADISEEEAQRDGVEL